MSSFIKTLHIDALILAILATLNSCGFISMPISVYYAFMILILFKYILKGRIIVANLSLLLLLAVAVCSIIFNDILPIFKSAERLIAFSILLLVVSPLIDSKPLRELRYYSFKYTIFSATILSVISVPCFYLGINFMKLNSKTDYMLSVGSFSGLYNQSMILGPMAAISSLMIMSEIMFNLKTKKQAILNIFLLLCTISAVFFAASRTAVLAMIITMFVLFIKRYSYNIIKMSKYLIMLMIILSLTFPLWNSLLDRVLAKQQNNIEMNKGSFSSRYNKWNARFYEIEKSPIIGVGFGAIDPKSKDEYNKKTGVIEPGSSWLYIISSLGFLGFLVFLIFIFGVMKKHYKNAVISAELMTNFGVVVFILISMVTEGYIFAAGNTLCFIFWLVIGNHNALLARRDTQKTTEQYNNQYKICG